VAHIKQKASDPLAFLLANDELLSVDLNTFLGTAAGDCQHHADPNRNDYTDDCPGSAYFGKNSGLPECSKNATD
jgi:hypothetical protein